MSNWIVDRSKILQRDEIARILTDLRRKARRSVNTRMNLAIFRLAACCGLRASEIAGLTLADVQVDNSRPSIRIRREIGKGHKARKVPLTWDAGTLADLVEWKRFRREQGAADDDLFVCSQHCDSLGNPLDRRNLRKRFKACCKVLGRERQGRVDDPRWPPFLRQPRPPRRPEHRGSAGRRRTRQPRHDQHLCSPGRYRRQGGKPLRLRRIAGVYSAGGLF